jgi:hypothetical protein
MSYTLFLCGADDIVSMVFLIDGDLYEGRKSVLPNFTGEA